MAKNYDPKNVIVTIGSQRVQGIADGTFISASRNNQTWNLVSGASGETARAKSNDRSGTVEITLMQTSLTNDVLSSYMTLDESPNSSGKFTLNIIDKNGRTILTAVEAWVQQPPTVEFGKELGDRAWTIETGDLEFTAVGGIGDNDEFDQLNL